MLQQSQIYLCISSLSERSSLSSCRAVSVQPLWLNVLQYFFPIFTFSVDFLSQTFTIHRTNSQRKGRPFVTSLPLPPASKILRHWPGNFFLWFMIQTLTVDYMHLFKKKRSISDISLRNLYKKYLFNNVSLGSQAHLQQVLQKQAFPGEIKFVGRNPFNTKVSKFFEANISVFFLIGIHSMQD